MIIEINKNLIPYSFQIDLDGIYDFEVRYNKEHDFFTLDLSLDDEVIIYGEKITYGRPLFAHLRHLNIPKITVIPVEVADKLSRITFENMNSEVFLFLDDGDQDG